MEKITFIITWITACVPIEIIIIIYKYKSLLSSFPARNEVKTTKTDKKSTEIEKILGKINTYIVA